MKMYLLALSLLLGVAHGEATKAYATLEEAAKAALSDAEALTGDFEAGGTIYQCGDSFAYFAPVTQHKRDHVDVPIYTLETCTLAGMYHTHPKGDARYSVPDIQTACDADTVSFIKPHGGAVRAFDCHGKSFVAKRIALTRPITGTEI